MLRFLSVRYWRRRLGRGAVSVFGVALGVGLIVSVGLINDTIVRTYVDLAKGVGRPCGPRRCALSTSGAWIRHGWVASRAFREVEVAVPLLEQQSFLFHEAHKVSLRVRGIDPRVDSAVRPLDPVSGAPTTS